MTICVKNKEYLFGSIHNGKMVLNEYGEIVIKEWLHTGSVSNNAELDAFIVMPNHMHGIIVLNDIVGATRRVAHEIIDDDRKTRAIHRIAPTTLPSNSIGSIIGQFKSVVAKKINQIRNTPGVSVWQRNYFERVIRNEHELNGIRKYIIYNPLKWDKDQYNMDLS